MFPENKISAPEVALALRSIPCTWYTSTDCQNDPAEQAYTEAVQLFQDTLSEDDRDRIWVRDKSSLKDVQNAVNNAKNVYLARSNENKAGKWLTKLAQRIMHYEKVMDTFANFHPEYCALAWGTMKFLLMAVINHQEYITQISKALAQIAAVLPRVNVKILLFPTEEIKRAVSTLYANVLRFMVRAMKWYTEGKFKHFITAVFRPAPLRFGDILEGVETLSKMIDELAVGASQAEQRNMHVLLQEIKRTMAENQAANSRIFLDARRQTCEIQFSQILSFTASTTLPDPEDTFRYCSFLSKRRRLKATTYNRPCWKSRKLKEWAASKKSSLILIKGSCLTRHETKDFAADIVGLLRRMKIPVIWTLSAKEGNAGWRSPIEVLKQLVLQILRLNHSLLDQQSTTLNAARFQSAKTESEWFQLLGEVLRGIPEVYIVIDAEVLNREFSSQTSWPREFFRLFDNIQTEGWKNCVKVVLASFGSSPFTEQTSEIELKDLTIRLDQRRPTPPALRRKAQFRAANRKQASDMLRPFVLQSHEPTILASASEG